MFKCYDQGLLYLQVVLQVQPLNGSIDHITYLSPPGRHAGTVSFSAKISHSLALT